jgi:hypothetical protein
MKMKCSIAKGDVCDICGAAEIKFCKYNAVDFTEIEANDKEELQYKKRVLKIEENQDEEWAPR